MKTTFNLFVILFVLAALQATPVCADDNGTPLCLTLKSGPKTNNNVGPRRAPARPTPLYMDLFLNMEDRTLDLYNPAGNTITYYIFNEDDDEMCSGTISFAQQDEASVSLASFPDGIYYLEIVVNGTTYECEFGLE